jgi:two-component system response regulator FixJ
MPSLETVFVIDDDAQLRESVCALVTSMGIRAAAFASCEEFLDAWRPDMRGAVVTDLRLPGLNGVELLEELGRRDIPLPLIVLTAYARTSTTVRAMKAGAFTIIDKPYNDDDLWDAIRAALVAEQSLWEARQRRRRFGQLLSGLTVDERQVLDCILAGKPNKAIASELRLGLRTVEKRRHAVISKLEADSVAQLVRRVVEAEFDTPTCGSKVSPPGGYPQQ